MDLLVQRKEAMNANKHNDSMSLVLTLEKVHLSGQCVAVKHGSTIIRHVRN